MLDKSSIESMSQVGEVVRGHDLQGWIRERSDLHMQIQSLKDQLDRERFVFHSSGSNMMET